MAVRATCYKMRSRAWPNLVPYCGSKSLVVANSAPRCQRIDRTSAMVTWAYHVSCMQPAIQSRWSHTVRASCVPETREDQLSDGSNNEINSSLSTKKCSNIDKSFIDVHPFECSRTFCTTDLGQRCPLAHHGLPLPRGNEQKMLETFELDEPTCGIRRRPLKCPRAYHALLVDAAGTLINTSQSTGEVYYEIGRKYGIQLSEEEISARYKAAYGQPWCRYRMRYEDDGRFFWQLIVEEATGCKDPALLEDLYKYYTTEKAWHIGDKDAEKTFQAMHNAGLKLAVVSNFDTRLKPLMRVLHCYDWFDAIIVSAEVGMEKPNPGIFWIACKELGVKPEEVLHVGDDHKNDILGASAAGCDSLLWGKEVFSFKEVAKKLGVLVPN